MARCQGSSFQMCMVLSDILITTRSWQHSVTSLPPKIEVGGEMKLIYVGELIKHIIDIIDNVNLEQKENVVIQQIKIQHTAELKVSQLLQLLEKYKKNYFREGEIPELDTPFKRNLFNTFLCYIDLASFFPFSLKLNTDERGSFVETVKLNSGGQVSFSTTVPGITRGNHFHTAKAERFAVIKGNAKIKIRKIGSDKTLSFELDGSQPSFVDMPVWYTHNITNIGNEDLYTIFWINEHFNPDDADTFFEKV
jgi:UDP-2-acetamido-2,6-beta-L-arabino-hexul-4-ose reductase